jgi:glycine/D-amino acid oxidase-like deaminating enzyme
MKRANESSWKEVPIPRFPKLSGSTTADVAIIGGGIAGVLSAYLLAKAGKKVVLLEAETLLHQATGLTTAFLTQSIDTDTSDQIDMFGRGGTKAIWQSHGKAIDLIEKIVKDEEIECEFMRCPNYLYAAERSQGKDLSAEYLALSTMRFPVEHVEPAALGFSNRGALAIPNQAKYHPLKFLTGVIEALVQMEVEIYEGTRVTNIERGRMQTISAGRARATAPWTLRATYQPFDNPKEVLLKKGMYKTYVVELEVPSGRYPEGIYEDLDNPYYYFRVDRGEDTDRIILGGEDHRVEIKMDEEKNFTSLLEYAEERFGEAYPVKRRWTGPILEPIDGLALIGEVNPKQLIATAFSGNGMTYGGITALMVRDLVTGKENPWKTLYDPKRMPSMTQLWKKGRDYTEELFLGAVANAIKRKK